VFRLSAYPSFLIALGRFAFSSVTANRVNDSVHDLWKKIQFPQKTPRPGLHGSIVLFILPDRGDSWRQSTGFPDDHRSCLIATR
jgi:hypothetical protein